MEESILTIYHCLSESKYPLTKSDISNKTGISQQLLNYWIPKMIECGIIVTDNRKRYDIQRILKDKSLAKHIKPLVTAIATHLDYSNVNNIEKAVEQCVALYLLDNITE